MMVIQSLFDIYPFLRAIIQTTPDSLAIKEPSRKTVALFKSVLYQRTPLTSDFNFKNPPTSVTGRFALIVILGFNSNWNKSEPSFPLSFLYLSVTINK